MSEGHPEPGTRVLLAMPSGALYPTSLDDVVDGALLVGAPAVTPEDLPALGDVFDLRWFSVRGRHNLPVSLRSITPSGYLAWYVDPVGEAVVRQDRQYVRAGGGEPVTFTRSDDVAGTHAIARGTVVDLSERALKARTSASDIRADEHVTVGITLGGSGLVVPGQVYKVLPTDKPEMVEVVVILDVTERQADAIRQYVFAAQRRERLRAAGAP